MMHCYFEQWWENWLQVPWGPKTQAARWSRDILPPVSPQRIWTKLSTLGLSPSLWSWVLNLMTNRPQTVRFTTAPPSLSLSTCSPQGCVGYLIGKIAEDSSVVRRIPNTNESKYRVRVQCQVKCCNLKEYHHYRRDRHRHLPPLHIRGATMEVVCSFRYLGI